MSLWYKYWIEPEGSDGSYKLVMQTWLTHPDRKISDDTLITGTMDEVHDYWKLHFIGDPPAINEFAYFS